MNRFGFQGRLNAAFPSQIILDTTELCNLACIHCPHPSFKKSVHFTGRALESELNEKIIDEVGSAGKGITQYVRFTGEGEPFLHPKVFDLLAYAVRRSGTTVTLTTNGTLLDAARIEKLIDTGVHLVDISMDAFKNETYSTIRVKGDLDVTRANVMALIKRVRDSGAALKVIVSFIEQPQNLGESGDFEKFWKDAGAHSVVIRRLHSGAGAVANVASQLNAAIANEARRPCLYPWERLVVNPRGELVFCPQDWVHGAVFADIRTTSIAEAWQSDFYRELREAHLKNEFAKHPYCGQCPDWSTTRWPEDGRSYADVVTDVVPARPGA